MQTYDRTSGYRLGFRRIAGLLYYGGFEWSSTDVGSNLFEYMFVYGVRCVKKNRNYFYIYAVRVIVLHFYVFLAAFSLQFKRCKEKTNYSESKYANPRKHEHRSSIVLGRRTGAWSALPLSGSRRLLVVRRWSTTDSMSHNAGNIRSRDQIRRRRPHHRRQARLIRLPR